jgi:opine dehydrogenase
MSHLGKQVGIETPTIDSMIQLASVLMNRDYAGEALRTPESLGIGELTAEQISSL